LPCHRPSLGGRSKEDTSAAIEHQKKQRNSDKKYQELTENQQKSQKTHGFSHEKQQINHQKTSRKSFNIKKIHGFSQGFHRFSIHNKSSETWRQVAAFHSLVGLAATCTSIGSFVNRGLAGTSMVFSATATEMLQYVSVYIYTYIYVYI